MDLDREKVISMQEGFIAHNGMRITVLESGYCECEVELTEKGKNLHGFAHGGLLFSLCDTAAGIAATATGRNVVTQSSAIHFLRPARGGVLTAKGKVVKNGTRTAFCTAEIFDETGLLLVSASFDMFFIS